MGERHVPRMLDFAAEYSRRLLLVAAALVVLGYVLVQLSGILLPTLVAILITALLYPAAEWLRGKGVPSLLATVFVMGAMLSAVVGAFAIVGPSTISQFDDLAAGGREGVQRLTTYVTEGPFGVSEADIDQRVSAAVEQVRQNLGGLAGRVVGTALIAVNALAGLVLVLFLVFFFVKDGERMGNSVVGLARPQWRADARELGRQAFEVLAIYARGVVFVATVDAVLIGLALLAIGVPLVLPLALVTFLAAFFPIIGAVLAGALAVLVALVSDGFVAAGLVLAAVVVIQQLEGNVLYPLIVGRSLHLHPAAMLLVLGAGSLVAGVAGALFAVPVASVVVVVAKYLRARERRHDASESADERRLSAARDEAQEGDEQRDSDAIVAATPPA